MKSERLADIICVGSCIAVCLFVISCNKTVSPESSVEFSKLKLLTWNRQTLVDAYQKVGKTNLLWDNFAKSALDSYARMRADENFGIEEQVIQTNCDAAIAAGCDDPMISYLHARFSLIHQDLSESTLADAFCKAAQAMKSSQYPNVRKFYAFLWAANHLRRATASSPSTSSEVHALRQSAMIYLSAALNDRNMPAQEVYDDCNCLLDLLQVNNVELEQCYSLIEPPLFAAHDKSTALLVKGVAYLDLAWQSRGGGYANAVTDDGWKNFKKRLGIAETALNEAWKLNPNDPQIATTMITLELGQGKGRDRMEMWFGRAMALDPDNERSCPCEAKRYYLEPKWYGSAEDMLAFGRECVASKEWGGNVPLTLVDAHNALADYLDESQRPYYWKQPGVWRDLRAAFTKYLQVNPNDFDEHQQFALFAYRCEQWDELNRQLLLLGKVHYDVFGGKNGFDKMVRLAKDHSVNQNN